MQVERGKKRTCIFVYLEHFFFTHITHYGAVKKERTIFAKESIPKNRRKALDGWAWKSWDWERGEKGVGRSKVWYVCIVLFLNVAKKNRILDFTLPARSR